MSTTNVFYAGPDRGPIRLADWQAVVNAAADGNLDESARIELKEKLTDPADIEPTSGAGSRDIGPLPKQKQGANRRVIAELAKDLASLSVTGGLFIVGITEEDKGRGYKRAGRVVGVDDPGAVATRIANAAVMQIEPSLHVETSIIFASDDSGRGVVIVSVPASPTAPHAADGYYWGRTDQSKRRLSDPEIERLMLARGKRSDALLTNLRALADEPFEATPDRYGPVPRYYLIVAPTAQSSPAAAALSDLLTGRSMTSLTRACGLPTPPDKNWVLSLPHPVAHPDGLRFENTTPQTGQAFGSGCVAIHLLLGDDGSVRVCGPAAVVDQVDTEYNIGTNGRVTSVDSTRVLIHMHAVLVLAAHTAAAHLGYHGPWTVGLRVTHLRQMFDKSAVLDLPNPIRSRYHGDEYEEVTATSTSEMLDYTPDIVCRLAKRLLRGLGVHTAYLPYDGLDDIRHRPDRAQETTG